MNVIIIIIEMVITWYDIMLIFDNDNRSIVYCTINGHSLY